MARPHNKKSRYTQQFEQQIRPRLELLYRQAFRLCGHRDGAEDLVQELVTRLHAKKIDLGKLENAQTWLLKSLYNLFIDRLRQEKRHLSVVGLGHDEALEADRYESPAPTPENQLSQQATRQRLQRALDGLNPDQRALIALHDIEGHTLQELETITGTPIGTLKSRLHRARLTLRTLIKEPFPEPRRVNE